VSNFHAIPRQLKSHSYFSKLNNEVCKSGNIAFYKIVLTILSEYIFVNDWQCQDNEYHTEKMKASYHGCVFATLQCQYDKGTHGTGAGAQIGGAHVQQSHSFENKR